MSKLFLLIVVIFMVNDSFCVPLSQNKPNRKKQETKMEQIIIVKKLPWEKNNFDIASFKIEKVEIRNDTLSLSVSYQGGCKKHKFQLYCSTFLYKSWPPQRDFWLSHEANSDSCNSTINQELLFNLFPLKTDNYDALSLRIYEFGYEHGKSEPINPLPIYKFKPNQPD